MFTLSFAVPAWASSVAPAAAVLVVASVAGAAATSSAADVSTAITAVEQPLQQSEPGPESVPSEAVAARPSGAADMAASSVVYSPPIDVAVSDPFRPPATFAGAGNRGLAYGTTAGMAVNAAAEGTVVFAGTIGAHSHVTIMHADGIRTSYSFLAATAVTVGDVVVAGQVVGETGDEPFHLGARVGDTYIDPALLMAPGAFAGPGQGGSPTKLPRSILVPRIGVPQ